MNRPSAILVGESGMALPEQYQTTISLEPASQNVQYVEFDVQTGPQVVMSTNRAEAAETDISVDQEDWHSRILRRARRSPYIVAAIVSLVVGILALIILPSILHKLSISDSSRY